MPLIKPRIFNISVLSFSFLIIDISCDCVVANYNKMRNLIFKLDKSSLSVGFIIKKIMNIANLLIIDILCNLVTTNYKKTKKLILTPHKSPSSVGFI